MGPARGRVSCAKALFERRKTREIVPQTLWKYEVVGHTQEAKQELLEYVAFQNTANVLNSVKPSKLIKQALRVGTSPNSEDIVMDFFAGSGPTAQAVLELNAEDGGNRRFVWFKLQNPCQSQRVLLGQSLI